MDTVLLLMDKAHDRRLLKEYLSDKYRLFTADDGASLAEHFDLCIVDGPALSRLRDQLSVRKAMEADAYLPVLLVTARREVSLLTANIWQIVDDVIGAPVHKPELYARVEVLLRSRRLSLELLAQKNSQLHRVETNLQASEHRFAILFAKSSFAAALSRLKDNVLVDVNEEFEHIFDISRQEAIGKALDELGIGLDAWIGAQTREDFLASGRIRGLDVQLALRSGEVRILSVNLDVIDIDGEPYILNTTRDVTAQRHAENELRKSEERFRSLFQNNHAVMLVIDPTNARIFDANPAACAYYGWSHAELTRMKITDINTLTRTRLSTQSFRFPPPPRRRFGARCRGLQRANSHSGA